MIRIKGDFGERQVRISGGYFDINDVEEIIGIVDRIDRENGTTSQLFDADHIAGREHLLHSAKLAFESIERGRAFADSPEIELVCWVAGRRQINKSLKRVGIGEDTDRVAIITIGESALEVEKSQKEIFRRLEIEEDKEVLEIDEDKLENLQDAFSITPKQLEVSSATDVVLEKVSLLSLER